MINRFSGIYSMGISYKDMRCKKFLVFLFCIYLISTTEATFFQKNTETKKNLRVIQKLKLSTIECTIKCSIIENCEVSGIIEEYCVLYELEDSISLTNSSYTSVFIEEIKLDKFALTFDSEEIQPQKGNLIGFIKLLQKRWTLSFDVKPEAHRPVLSNILHFTNRINDRTYGDMTPAIHFVQNSTIIRIASAVNGDTKYFYYHDAKELPFQAFTNIDIRQEPINSNYCLTIRINRTIVHQVVNDDAREFSNVSIYLSIPGIPPAKVMVKNLYFFTW